MKFVILGCGSSMGVPRPDGHFGNCDPKNKKNICHFETVDEFLDGLNKLLCIGIAEKVLGMRTPSVQFAICQNELI